MVNDLSFVSSVTYWYSKPPPYPLRRGSSYTSFIMEKYTLHRSNFKTGYDGFYMARLINNG